MPHVRFCCECGVKRLYCWTTALSHSILCYRSHSTFLILTILLLILFDTMNLKCRFSLINANDFPVHSRGVSIGQPLTSSPTSFPFVPSVSCKTGPASQDIFVGRSCKCTKATAVRFLPQSDFLAETSDNPSLTCFQCQCTPLLSNWLKTIKYYTVIWRRLIIV